MAGVFNKFGVMKSSAVTPGGMWCIGCLRVPWGKLWKTGGFFEGELYPTLIYYLIYIYIPPLINNASIAQLRRDLG